MLGDILRPPGPTGDGTFWPLWLLFVRWRWPPLPLEFSEDDEPEASGRA